MPVQVRVLPQPLESMDHDTPEREVLNLLESKTIYEVSLRRFFRAHERLTRSLAAFDNARILVSPLLDGDLDIEH